MSSPAIKLLTASVVLCFGCASYAANQTINTDLVVVAPALPASLPLFKAQNSARKSFFLKKSVRRRQLPARRSLFAVDSEWTAYAAIL